MSVDSAISQRIILIGSSNSGKSTLAERIAAHRDVPFIELDALHWEPNWTEADPDVFRERVRGAIEPDAWVMAGNYITQQQTVSWPRADTIVWLDLSLRIVLPRCVRRCWSRWRSGELLWGTNRETFWEHLMLWDTERSLIAYTIKHHRRRRREFETFIHDPRWSHITFVRLRSPDEIDAWSGSVFELPSATSSHTVESNST
jgi:adenylate kinase family enzyme